ncbi:hypothetical protein BDV41DRAFT_82112 [Aspergillus transmontanensis]|uniref:Uncharacterized protein n=1 Tax=Aspergillus transmontanensis TaxID=1034304 RepID=A0A5N6VFE8_9EURO|nr:hypothetical protein BDV41DRAFT_82112 [Aspergillus transmontanensis]
MAVAVRDKKFDNAWVSEKVFSPCRDLQTRFSLFVFSITAGLIVSILIRPTLTFLDFEFDWCQFYFDCPVLNFERCPCLSTCGPSASNSKSPPEQWNTLALINLACLSGMSSAPTWEVPVVGNNLNLISTMSLGVVIGGRPSTPPEHLSCVRF